MGGRLRGRTLHDTPTGLLLFIIHMSTVPALQSIQGEARRAVWRRRIDMNLCIICAHAGEAIKQRGAAK